MKCSIFSVLFPSAIHIQAPMINCSVSDKLIESKAARKQGLNWLFSFLSFSALKNLFLARNRRLQLKCDLKGVKQANEEINLANPIHCSGDLINSSRVVNLIKHSIRVFTQKRYAHRTAEIRN